MSLQDPIADMLTRLRNAGAAGLEVVEMPGSKEKLAIAEVMKSEGYIADYQAKTENKKGFLVVTLKYYEGKPVIEGLQRISKPSCRIYCGAKEIPNVRNGLGTVIMTTPKGVMSGKKAAAENIGGEVLCYIW
ncbi:MAG: 30S ribosomal protein S8 [Victivallaceae bacterium]|nr:30S ribosomal protein S8 [Victivallaceae bacterium]